MLLKYKFIVVFILFLQYINLNDLNTMDYIIIIINSL